MDDPPRQAPSSSSRLVEVSERDDFDGFIGHCLSPTHLSVHPLGHGHPHARNPERDVVDGRFGRCRFFGLTPLFLDPLAFSQVLAAASSCSRVHYHRWAAPPWHDSKMRQTSLPLGLLCSIVSHLMRTHDAGCLDAGSTWTWLPTRSGTGKDAETPSLFAGESLAPHV